MKVVILTYFQSFSLHPHRSTDQARVITVELSNGKMLDPVSLKVPAFATPQDVDSFVQDLCDFDGTTGSPFACARVIFTELKGLVDSTSSKAQATSQVSVVCSSRLSLCPVRPLILVIRWPRPKRISKPALISFAQLPRRSLQRLFSARTPSTRARSPGKRPFPRLPKRPPRPYARLCKSLKSSGTRRRTGSSWV